MKNNKEIIKKVLDYICLLYTSFFVAAPLIANNPELVINGYSIKEYYKNHVLRACTPSDKLSVCLLYTSRCV